MLDASSTVLIIRQARAHELHPRRCVGLMGVRRFPAQRALLHLSPRQDRVEATGVKASTRRPQDLDGFAYGFASGWQAALK